VAQWASTQLGQYFTKCPPWEISLDGEMIVLSTDGQSHNAAVLDPESVTIKTGAFWASVVFRPAGKLAIQLDGIPNVRGRDMLGQVQAERARQLAVIEARRKCERFDTLIAALVAWYRSVVTSINTHDTNRWWIATEVLQRWIATKSQAIGNGTELEGLLIDSDVTEHLKGQGEAVHNALAWRKKDLLSHVAVLNDSHLKRELVECKDFFDKIEKSPLTVEQAKSVVCFDNRVLVVASAGSGKTSTMVAKAGYALHRNVVPPERILLLAFNKEAAKELQLRVQERLSPLGFASEGIIARTFHKFGLDVIGHATGKKPSLASWLEGGRDLDHLSSLIDGLKDSNPLFRTRWDLFRVVLSRDLPKFGKEEEGAEDRDRNTKKYGFRTLRDEVVKSHGERMIADWLFYNGVDYEYEPAYLHETADAAHRQYHPDFFYPTIDLYHEHFALDANGQPPPEFTGYMQGIEWKRSLHAKHATALIETTSAQLRTGAVFQILEKELTARGVELDPNVDRETTGRKPIENEELVRLFRTFLTHAKSNDLADQGLRERLRDSKAGAFVYRHEMFLDLFEDIRNAWEKSLRASNSIDFEDMLNIAADHLESGRWESPYTLVMVDEFQDASRARARLTRALVNKPNRFLFAVGDDWQSINRFAGADLAVMTKFDEWFGKSVTLKLERTFRCPQSICDVSSKFVLKNPVQLPKVVKSTQPEHVPSVQGFQVDHDGKLQTAIALWMASLCSKVATGAVAPGKSGKLSVFVLGRYNRDAQLIPEDWQAKFGRYLEVKFSSIHGSKGLEADYVILPRVVNSRSSFPSMQTDDPVLQLAMPSGDSFQFSEERRLFYVALTRARRSVVLFTVDGNISPFVVELMKDTNLELERIDGEKTKTRMCPAPECKTGVLVKRKGPYSEFWGCNRFPKCRHSEKIVSETRSAK
jgi:DNA helicase-4